MPSCLNLSFRRAFAACPRLGSCNCVHGSVVADHRTRRASEKLGLRLFFGNRRPSQTGADRNRTNPAPHRLVLPKTYGGNAPQTLWFPLREPPTEDRPLDQRLAARLKVRDGSWVPARQNAIFFAMCRWRQLKVRNTTAIPLLERCGRSRLMGSASTGSDSY
jgi:hypothetical protein